VDKKKYLTGAGNEKRRQDKMKGEFVRLSLSLRIQHIVLIVSFFLLMATGFPMLFPESDIIQKFFLFTGSIELRGILHRIGAIMLIGLCIYHILYCIYSQQGKKDIKEMVVNKKDVKDIFRQLSFNLGLSNERPQYGRFNFIEKFEYYSVIWGSIIMITTGLIMWFEEFSLTLFPKWFFDVIVTIHSLEAILAFMVIIIWHFYNVHFRPGVFPMSRVWLNGRISKEDLMFYHPLEYQEIIKERKVRDITAHKKSETDRKIKD